MGILTQAVTTYGPGARVVFVSVDPERDTVDWLKEYVRYLPTGLQRPDRDAGRGPGRGRRLGRPLREGRDGDARRVLDVAHRRGLPRRRRAGRCGPTSRSAPRPTPSSRPCGPWPAPMGPRPRRPRPRRSRPRRPTPSGATAAPSPAEALTVEVVSSSVWARGRQPGHPRPDRSGRPPGRPRGRRHGPGDLDRRPGAGQPGGRRRRPTARRRRRFVRRHRRSCHPRGWGLAVTVDERRRDARRSDVGRRPSSRARRSSSAGRRPTIRTPTLDDVGGVALRVTTDPVPDLRLSRTSTADALAAGRAVHPRRRLDPVQGHAGLRQGPRAGQVPPQTAGRPSPFIHLEPYAYDVVTRQPGPAGQPRGPDPRAGRRCLGHRRPRRGASARCPGSSSSTATGRSSPSTRA